MHHSFDIEHARLYGLEEAVLINNLLFWIVRNRANGENFRDGRTWSFNSVRAYSEQFPYLTANTIRRTLESLIKQGVVVASRFAESGLDRTNWYAFADEDAFLMVLSHSAELPDGEGETDESHSAKKPNATGKKAKSLIREDVNANVNADSKRGSRLADDWFLRPSWAREAVAIHSNWTVEHTRFEAEKFKDHWCAKPGREGRKLDWLATWRNWVRTAGAMRVEKGGANAQWWHSEVEALAKAKEVGVGPAHSGESEKTWHARIRAAIDNGGKPPAPREHIPPSPAPGLTKAEPRAAVSAENRAALLDAAKRAGANRHQGDNA